MDTNFGTLTLLPSILSQDSLPYRNIDDYTVTVLNNLHGYGMALPHGILLYLLLYHGMSFTESLLLSKYACYLCTLLDQISWYATLLTPSSWYFIYRTIAIHKYAFYLCVQF